jgi:hypothetical protein
MVEKVLVHLVEKIFQVLHYLLVVRFHKHGQCFEQSLEPGLMEIVCINGGGFSILVFTLIRKFLESFFHQKGKAVFFGVLDDGLKQKP